MNQMNRVDLSQPVSPNRSSWSSIVDDIDVLLTGSDQPSISPSEILPSPSPQQEKRSNGDGKVAESVKEPSPVLEEKKEVTVKSLGDLTVQLENIKPSK